MDGDEGFWQHLGKGTRWSSCMQSWVEGVQSSSTFDWSLFPWFPGREGPLFLLLASPPPPACMFRDDSLEKLV